MGVYESYFDKNTGENFCCSKIENQFKPDEIDRLIKTKPDVEEIKYIQVRPKKYEKRKRRFENPNYDCRYCSKEILMSEKDHYLSCEAFGTPIEKSDIRNLRRQGLKRLRLMSTFEIKSLTPDFSTTDRVRMMADSYDWNP